MSKLWKWSSIGQGRSVIALLLALVLLLSPFSMVQVKAAATPPTKVALVGNLQPVLVPGANEWDPATEATVMEDKGNGLYQFTGVLPAGSYDYKIALNGTWDASYGNANYTKPGKPDGDNIKLTLAEETEVTFYYNHNTKQIADSTYYTPIEAAKQPRIVGNVQPALGEANEWNPATATHFLTDDNFDNVYTLTAEVPAGSYEFKVVLGDNWEGVEAYPADNYAFSLEEAQSVTFTYNADTDAVVVDASIERTLRVHYKRTGNDYENMGLWLWGDVAASSEDVAEWPAGATEFPTGQTDSYGAYVDIPLKANPKSVQFIVLNKDKDEKDGDAKKVIFSSPEVNEVWIEQGSDNVLTYEPADIPENTVRIHYNRADGNYEKLGLWIWEDVQAPSTNWPSGATSFVGTQVDRYGAYLDIPLAEAAKKIGFLVVNKETQVKDGDNKGFSLLGQYNRLWIFEGDDTVYTSPYKEIPVGMTAAEVVSPEKLWLSFTVTEGLEAEAVKAGLTIKDADGTELEIKKVTILNSRTIEVETTIDLDKLPLTVSYDEKTSSAGSGWRLIDNLYNYEGDDLGATYSNGDVTFKLWAPLAEAVKVKLYNKDDATNQLNAFELQQGEQGVWSLRLTAEDASVADLNGYYYQYEVTNDGVAKPVLDPYAKSMAPFTVNTKGEAGADGDITGKAAIVDLSGTDPADFDFADIEGYEKREDAIIWEAHIRDFTSDPSIEGDLNARWGSYAAFADKLDYIKSLGVTHVQLLPVMAWYYGDETNMNERELDYSAQNNEYNWGYDPHNYFSPDGAYSEDPADAALRVKELKELIAAIHDAGMGVIFDVVYTHMAKADFLNDIVPGYYFFKDTDGNFIGAFGNNLATSHAMSEKLMVDSVKYWFEEYKIDGMRWDMMGDATYPAVQRAYDEAAAINPNALFIGEGWVTFSENNSETELIGQGADQLWMDKTNDVGVFSDEIRNELKSGFGSEGQPRFITGGARDITTIFNNIKGQPSNTPADAPGDMVQYIEAHDNLTLYDVIVQTIKKDPSIAANDLEVHKRIRLGNLLVLTSQGTAFLHAGQEYGRTKQWLDSGVPEQKHTLVNYDNGESDYFIHDSYDSSDAINKFDWQKATDADLYPVNAVTKDYTAGLIELRKSTEAFRLGDAELVDTNVELLQNTGLAATDLAIAYKAKSTDGSGEYYVLVNTDNQTRTINLETDLTGGIVIVDNDEAGTTEVNAQSGFTLTESSITLEPLTAVIIRMETEAAQLESVALNSESESLSIGSKHQLKAYALYDDGARRTVTEQAMYESDNQRVAAVDSKGLITAKAAGTATITVTYQGKSATTTITVTKDAVERTVQIHYSRPDKDYTDWILWVWGTGPDYVNGQVNFTRFENGVAIADIKVSPTAKNVGFLVLKGTDWTTNKRDYPGDRTISLEPGAELTKVYVTSVTPEFEVIPQVNGPVLDDGGVTFYYRDDVVFRTGDKGNYDGIKVKIDDAEYDMVYDEKYGWFSYRLEALTIGAHEYTFLITRDGVTEESSDPYNTVNGQSVIVYEKPGSTLTATVEPAEITANTHAIIKAEASLANQYSFTKAFVDLSTLGGPAKVPFDIELMEQTIAVKDSVTAGDKQVVLTLVDEFGNHHKQNITVQVKARTSVGKLDFDWDEARIYFALTDRFADGDQTNNVNVDKTHPEAYHGGDFRGMIDKLDYLQELGINTLWITPIVDNIDFNKGVDFNDTQYGYHGYWAKDFEQLDEHLGDLDTFKELINEAHDRGIKIMVDVVLNHAGYGLKESDNYPGVTAEDKERFADMLRTDSISADEDLIHGELAGLPDFKTEDPLVRKQVIAWQTAWLEHAQTDRGDTIDYFRVDTVKHVEETTWKAFKNELTKLKPDFKLVGEYFGATVDFNSGALRSGQMDGLLDFEFNDRAQAFTEGKIDEVDNYLARRELKIDNTATMAQFLSSHDEDGFLSEHIGGDLGKLKIAAALQITAKGQPVIYYGEELGQSGKTGGDLAKGEYSENRDDMPWHLLDPVQESDTEEQAAAKVEAQALHQHYEKLLNIRDKFSKVYAKGDRTKLAGSDELGYLAFNKHYNGTDVVTIINTKTDAVSVELSVPFVAGTVATDEYSGATYTVNADRKVVVAVAGRNDGGTVVLSGVSEAPQVEIPTGNNNNQASNEQSISADELAKAAANPQNGVVNVPVASGKQAAKLNVQDLKALGENALQLTGDGIALTLSNSTLADIQTNAAANKLNNANALIGFQKLAEAKTKEALEKLASAKSASGSVQLKPASPIFDISLQLIDQATGNKQAINPQGVTVAFKIDKNANPDLLGVYDVNGTYIGGVVDGDQIIVTLQQAGQYVVLEWEKTYNDVSDAHWAANAIEMLSAKHVVNGVSDTMFAPNLNITRAEFAAMLVRTLGLRVNEDAATAFNDVQQNAWYNGYIAAASESGLIKGRSDSEFAPNAVVSREEMAVMIMRAWAVKTGADAAATGSQSFADQEQFSAWAEEAIKQATELGLLNGKTNGKFDPQGSLTRAEGAQALYRFLKK